MASISPPPDPQIAEAKASMFARMDELSRRFQTAKAAVDLRSHIQAHPLAAAGIAFAAGLMLGARSAGRARMVKAARAAAPGPGAAKVAAEAGIATALFGLLSTLVIRLAKDAAFQHVSGYAKQWWETQRSREAAESHAPDTAPFVRH